MINEFLRTVPKTTGLYAILSQNQNVLDDHEDNKNYLLEDNLNLPKTSLRVPN